MNSEHPYIALLERYQEASNRHDIEACVAMFADNGVIMMGGESYAGADALRDAHEYDLGSQTLVAFRDLEVDGDLIRCTFWNEHELSRVIGNGGMTGKAEFTIKDDRIHKFNILPPGDDERTRVMEKAAPVLKWLRENHPDAVAKWKGFDRSAGEAVFALAELWRKHQQETD